MTPHRREDAHMKPGRHAASALAGICLLIVGAFGTTAQAQQEVIAVHLVEL
jgi:hypothetical protein